MSKSTRNWILAVLLLLLEAPATAPARAQTEPRQVTDDEVNAIARDLYCPVCEATPLDVCPTQACADWRDVIRTKLAEGQSESEIRAYFAEQYGARALSEPPREGFTLAVWILPIVAVAAGAFFFSRYLAQIRTPAHPAGDREAAQEPGEVETAVDDYQARIEQELREM
jgi:cytochrome c-type biogenesis protein CcmH